MLGFLFLAISILGIIKYTKDLPDYKQLRDYSPSVISRLYTGDGSLLAEFSIQKRIFVPVENMLNKFGLKTITNNIGSFNKGDKRDIIQLKNGNKKLNFLPLICYEIIYSGNLTRNFDFDFILNISEDGWFGKSIGPKQHFSHSIFRAIETGKYVVRSSNNGVAALINPLGEIEQKIDYGKTGFIDFQKKKDFDRTIFSTYGNVIFLILILLYIFLAISFNRIRNE